MVARTLPILQSRSIAESDGRYPVRARLGPLKVGLVNMPFSTCKSPSIQLGLLQAIAREHGVPARTHYLNMLFAQELGWERYEALCTHSTGYLFGDWLFAREAFAEQAPHADRYLNAFSDHLDAVAQRSEVSRETLLKIRDRHVPRFLERCLDAVRWEAYDVVGFSSVFRQNCAALALARKIKQRWSHVQIVFGGANFEGELGLEFVRSIAWIDFAVVGEGDVAFVELLEALSAGRRDPEVRGVAYRRGSQVRFAGHAPAQNDLDALPCPDYDDYFDAARALGLPAHMLDNEVVLPFETARGCWWGQKHQCTFCGLFDDEGMRFRSKSPARVVADIHDLATRYGVRSFAATDLILDRRYVDEVFGELAARREDYSVFYELKSNTKPDALRTMARGGLRYAQPGIESLDSHVLELMDKGVTAIQNVRFLKWATYYGIRLTWHLLRGFPGERPQDYESQIRTIGLIRHLQPPDSRSVRIFLEKFSPNFDRADQLGFLNVRPCASYGCVYPAHVRLTEIARTFDYDRASEVPAEVIERLDAELRRWKEAWKGDRPRLRYRRGPGQISIADDRASGRHQLHVFRDETARVYDACARTYKGVTQVAGEAGIAPSEARACLDELTSLGLILEERGRYLGLALPVNRHW